MTSIRSFIRHTSAEWLEPFFDRFDFPATDWQAERKALNKQLFAHADTLLEHSHQRLSHEIHRIGQIAKWDGHKALLGLINGYPLLEKLESTHDISCWFYLHEPKYFRHAEDICLANYFRGGSNRYYVPLEVSRRRQPLLDQAYVDFEHALRQQLPLNEKLKVEYFMRDKTTVQIMVYLEGITHSELEFDEKSELHTRLRKPVHECALLYQYKNGSLEIIGQPEERRKLLAESFTQFALKETSYKEKIKKLDLNPLKREPRFVIDPEDGIDEIKVTELNFENKQHDTRHLHTAKVKSTTNLYQLLGSYAKPANPLNAPECELKRAKLRFKLIKRPNSQKRCMNLVVTERSINWRDYSYDEQQLAEKYLQQIGVLQPL